MRRAPFVVGGTIAGVAGLLVVHPHAASPSLGIAASTPASASTASSPTTTAPGARTGPGGQTAGTTPTTPSTSPTTTAPPVTTAPSTTTAPPVTTAPPTTTTAPVTKTEIGTAVNYSYGVLSVQVTLAGHKITDVAIASLNDGGNPRSASIDQQAIPTLEQEAMVAQSANIQGVSGASYTSAGFARSLQSALSKAGL